MIGFGSNILSLGAQTALDRASDSLSRSFERLSSGQRINRASDDAAGLAVSTILNTSTRVYTQGIRNLSDGVSLVNIADGALDQLGGIVGRMRELAIQAGNGVFSNSQRQALNVEAQSLSAEYLRIVQSTRFNGRNIFSADFGTLRLQAGFGADESIGSTLGGAVGGATFQTSRVTNDGISSNYSVAGDVNGDGKADLVSIGANGASIVAIGNGDGTFARGVTYANGFSTSSKIQLGDLNNDGRLDLITTGYTGTASSVSIRFGNGDGTFGNATSFSIMSGSTVSGLDVGDVNNDGYLDVITSGVVGAGGDETVSVRLGSASGTLGAETVYTNSASQFFGYALALGDLNNDGNLDMVVTSEDIISGYGVYNIRYGNGDGTFGTVTSYDGLDVSQNDIEIGDINSDGFLDIISLNGAGAFEGLLSNGDGTFAAPILLLNGGTGGALVQVALEDFNGDGQLDLFGVDINGIGVVALGNGNGTFTNAVSSDFNIGNGSGLAVADFNNDGVLDAAAASGTSYGVMLQNITSGIGALLSFDLSTQAGALQAAPYFEQTLNRINSQRGVVGAFGSRLESALDVVRSRADAQKTAESRIRDIDVAEETTQVARLQIVRSAATAILAQANQQPTLALQILKAIP